MRSAGRIFGTALFAVSTLIPGAVSSHAANGDCGIPFTSGASPKTSDCLYILKTGVGLLECELCVCDTNGNQAIAASDALLCLRRAVGQNVAFHCPACTTTTTLAATTTTLPATTTTLPGATTTTTLPPPTTTTLLVTTTTMGSAGGSCPAVAEWISHAFVGAACDVDGDCPGAACENGHCTSVNEVSFGWTGSGHHAALDEASTLVNIGCSGSGGSCGSCNVAGIDPAAGNCRCNNDLRRHCDEPFALDKNDCPACFAGAFVGNPCTNNADCTAGTCARHCSNDSTRICAHNNDCGAGTCLATTKCTNGKNCNVDADCIGTCTTGSMCQCFDGPPQPLLAGNLPLCVLSRYESNVSGSVNVDTGAGSLEKSLTSILYGGVSATAPCPYCGGACSNDGTKHCAFDTDCSGGSCVLDPTPRDGLRGGVCIGGVSDGLACDVQATNGSFPSAPGGRRGGGYSLDCLPSSGQGVTGLGLTLTLTETSGTTHLGAGLSCGGAFAGLDCPCLACSGDATVPCRNNADCAAAGGTCSSNGAAGVAPQPNSCDGHLCSDPGDGFGSCTSGPDDFFCDGVLQAGGRGIFACTTNADCAAGAVGVDAGHCTLAQRRACFAGAVNAAGAPDPIKPVLAAAFCVAPVTDSTRNAALGLPGPGLDRHQSRLRSYCSTSLSQQYTPGTGGCP